MAQSFSYAFMPYSPVGTTSAVVGSSVTTVSIGPTGTGLPAQSVSIVNQGTATLFVGGWSAGNTTTIGVTTGYPILSNTDRVIRIQGASFLQLLCASTFTVTAFVTPGEGVE